MREVIPQCFQCKKGHFGKRCFFIPSVEFTWGRESSSFWSDFIPKAPGSQAGRSCTKVVEDLEGVGEAPEIS